MTQQDKALATYVKMLNKEQEIFDTYKAEMDKLLEDKAKVEKFLMNSGEFQEIPEIIKERSPFLAWKILPKTDESVIATHMQIDDVLIPQVTKTMKDKIKELDDQLSQVESWALAELVRRKASNASVKGVGRVELRTDAKYSINDKREFIGWAVDNNMEEELTVSLRPNSKFVTRVVEETGELPPAVSSFRENKVVFVKA